MLAGRAEKVTPDSLLQLLLARGDIVSIDNGKLRIVPASGLEPPRAWLEANSLALEREILSTVGIDAHRYEGYSTGRYAVGERGIKAPGVTLQLASVLGHYEAYSLFNASLDRARGPNKGKALPKGQFRVGTRHAFYKFWLRTGLKIPPLHKFHDYLGNLKELLLTGEPNSKGRILITSLRPLTLKPELLKGANQPPKCHLTPTQIPPNSRPVMPPKDSVENHTEQRFQPDRSTGASNHVNKVIREYVYKDTTSKPIIRKSPEEQTVEEWLADYGD